MSPGRNKCYNDWALESKSYLASRYYDHPGFKEYVCTDDPSETLASGSANQKWSSVLFRKTSTWVSEMPAIYRRSRDYMCCLLLQTLGQQLHVKQRSGACR